MLTHDEIMELLRQVEEDMPRLMAIKKEQLELFYALRPKRCGKIDFDKIEVQYDDEKYTEWHSNYGIETIEDRLRIFDLVGLDYELRIADIYDPSSVFSIYHANTEEDNLKYRVARELYNLYCQYYKELLKENGIDVKKIAGYRYLEPWLGCEKVIMPEKYNEGNTLVSEEKILSVLKDLYNDAYKKATAPKPIFQLNFEKIETPDGERRLCKAKLDEEHLKDCREKGVHFLQINIDAKSFEEPIREEVEEERKIFYFEFLI